VRSIQLLLMSWLLMLAVLTTAMPAFINDFNLATIGISLIVGAFMFPGVALVLGMVAGIVALDSFYVPKQFVQDHFSILGMNSFQKVVSLLLTVPALVRCGIKKEINYSILSIIVMACISVAFGKHYGGLTPVQIVKTI